MYNEFDMLLISGKNRGNITIILLGLISVMLIMVMALSRRMSGHVQLLTLSDYTQISRYFLESYTGDVLRQINTQANKVDSKMFKAFRGNATNKKLDTSFYKPSPMLESLAKELKIEFGNQLEVSFKKTTELTYPRGFYCPNYKGKEKRGSLEIVCNATFRKKRYTLRVQYPYKVVARMTPIIKDFVLFADRISEEQGREKIGPDDKLNIMFTKGGKHPLVVDGNVLSLANGIPITQGTKYRPFMILPPQDSSEFNDRNVSGKVYLGSSNDPVYLNLAGDISDKTQKSVGELFMVSPNVFNVATKNSEFSYVSVLQNKKYENISMLGLDVPIKYHQRATMGILGFSVESVPSLGPYFKDTAYQPSDFFGTPGNGCRFWEDIEKYGTGYMAFASGLKPMGLKTPKGIFIAREIYGNVLARFFVLTFWYPDNQSGEALQYKKNSGQFPSVQRRGITVRHFKPLYANQKYQDFMSRIVSGELWNPSNKLPDGFVPYNYGPGGLSKSIYTFKKLHTNDNSQPTVPLDQLGRSWFKIHTGGNTREKSGIEQRITKVFASGDEFLKAAQADGRFDVNGVVYVNGDLKMPALEMESNKIGGGVILVGGRITLKNITRGHKIDTDKDSFAQSLSQLYQKLKTEVKQDNYLTFVSLNGEPITIDGEVLLGVHLINFCDPFKRSRPYDQIIWRNPSRKEILFCGGIACDYLNLPNRLKEFGNVRTPNKVLGAPFFMYHSAMAAPKPSFAAQTMEHMRGYKLTAKGVAQ